MDTSIFISEFVQLLLFVFLALHDGDSYHYHQWWLLSRFGLKGLQLWSFNFHFRGICVCSEQLGKVTVLCLSQASFTYYAVYI